MRKPIYKNGKGADFADIFMVLCTSNESKVLFYIQVTHTDRVNTSVDKRKEEETITVKEAQDEYKKLEKYKESQWGNDLTTVFIIITNRTISDGMEFPCIGRDLFVDYFGSFAQAVSYLNVAEIPFMDMSLDDFSFITKTCRAYTFTNIRSNWKFMNDEQRAKMLANSLTMPHLKNLFTFVKEKPIVASAIEQLMTRSHISPSEI